jgi:thioredoxin-dependent peroxiredoxin
MKKTLLIILTITLMSLSFSDNPIKVGDSVPDFVAVDDQGRTWMLSDHLRINYLVIYFYPAAFTGGCTTQACSYRDLNKELAMMNASVVGISGDETNNLSLFKKENNLNFTLLSDKDGAIAKIFGVTVNDGGTIDTEIGGQKLQLTRGVTTSRWTFVIDGNGKLIYRDNNVNASTDSQTVLEFIKTHEQRKTCR